MADPTSKPSDQPSSSATVKTPGHMSPGDQAPPGTPGTGENICPACAGTGIQDGKPCRECEGTGSIITGIGGA